MNAWPFDQSPITAAITTRQVIEGKKDICVVLHYSDDHSWAFLCGTTDEEKDGRVIAMKEALKIDETIIAIADLPSGWKAWRENRSSSWHRAPNEERAQPAVAAQRLNRGPLRIWSRLLAWWIKER